MKQVLISLFVLILINGKSFGQETVRLFLNENFESTDSLNASYIREATIINEHYHITDYNINGEIIHYGEYISVNPWIEDGLAKNYSTPGVLYSEGNYDNGQITGEWLYYNAFEQSVDTVYYDWDKINSITGDCYPDDKKLKYNRRESREIETIVDAFTEFFHSNIHFPARTQRDELGSYASIYFVMEDHGRIRCLNIHRIEDADLIAEIQRVVSEFNYTKNSKKPLKINLSWTFDDYAQENDTLSEVDRQMPTFSGGGFSRFENYIYANMIYPEHTGNMGIQGTVIVRFFVETDGSVSNVEIMKSVDPYLDAEVLRVVKASPRWEPGKEDGEPARMFMMFPVRFRIRH